MRRILQAARGVWTAWVAPDLLAGRCAHCDRPVRSAVHYRRVYGLILPGRFVLVAHSKCGPLPAPGEPPPAALARFLDSHDRTAALR